MGGSLKQAVYRAIYGEVNARLQAEASRLGDITFLNAAEAANAAATNDQVVDRPWGVVENARRGLVGTAKSERAGRSNQGLEHPSYNVHQRGPHAVRALARRPYACCGCGARIRAGAEVSLQAGAHARRFRAGWRDGHHRPTVSQGLAEAFGQPVVVENRPGASSQIAGELVAKAPPDGQTPLMTTQTLMTSQMIEKKTYPDFVKDFAPVSLCATGTLILVVHPSVPANP